MSFCVQWIEAGKNQATDFPDEEQAEAFANDRVRNGTPYVVVFEVA